MSKNNSSRAYNWAKFFKSLAHHPKVQEARKKIRAQAELVWSAEHGSVFQQCTHALEDALERFKTSAKLLSEAETKLRKTEKYISSAQAHSTGTSEKVRFRDWPLKDKALLWLTLTGAVGASALGMLNLKANLLASGTVIFIDQPELATALSLILPLGALALKFTTNFMRYDRSRRIYCLLIYFLLLTLVLVWSWLFAKQFPGLSAEIDLEQLLSGGAQGPLLVWSQLLIEMLSGTALFLAAENIYLKYSPNYFYENPEYREAEKAYKKYHEQHQALITQIGQLQGQVSTMEAEREAYINQIEAEFTAYHARFKAAQDADLF